MAKAIDLDTIKKQNEALVEFIVRAAYAGTGDISNDLWGGNTTLRADLNQDLQTKILLHDIGVVDYTVIGDKPMVEIKSNPGVVLDFFKGLEIYRKFENSDEKIREFISSIAAGAIDKYIKSHVLSETRASDPNIINRLQDVAYAIEMLNRLENPETSPLAKLAETYKIELKDLLPAKRIEFRRGQLEELAKDLKAQIDRTSDNYMKSIFGEKHRLVDKGKVEGQGR